MAVGDMLDSKYALPVVGTVSLSTGLLLGALVILVIWFLYSRYWSEGLMPSDTARYQRVSLSGSEAMDNTRTGSYFAAAQQGPSVQWMQGIIPGSSVSNAEILASPDFNCSKRKLDDSDTGAWDWMNQVVKSEGLTARPRTDSDLTLAMSGM